MAGGFKRQWGGWNRRRLVILVTISSESLDLKPILSCGVMKCLISFSVTLKWLIMNDIEMPFILR